MNRATIGAVVVACWCTSGCGFKAGFRVPKEEFHAKVKRVAIAPVRVTLDVLLPGNLDERAAWNGRAAVDEALRPTLTSCGFEVVPRDAAMDVVERRIVAVGVPADHLGRLKKDVLLKWRSAVIDALESQASTHADAVVFPVLAYRKGTITGSTEAWDGIVEKCRAVSAGEIMAAVIGGPLAGELAREAGSNDGVSLVVEVYLVTSPSTCVWYGSALISGMREGKDYKYDSSGALADESLIRRAVLESLVKLDRKWKDPWENRSSLFEEKAP